MSENRLRTLVNNYLSFFSEKNISVDEAEISIKIFGTIDIIKNSLLEIENEYLLNLIDRLSMTYDTINQWINGDIERSLAQNNRNRILNHLYSLYQWIIDFTDKLNLLNNRSRVRSKEIENLEKVISSINKERQELLSALGNLKDKSESDANVISDLKNRMEIELEEFDERFRKNLGDYELLAQEKIFREESDNTISRWIWMLIIGLISIVLIIMCFQFMEGCWIDIDCLVNKKDKLISIGAKKSEVLFYYELFKPTVLRFFIISILIMLLRFAISNYNAIMHNRVVNLHKANSLAAMLRVINRLPDENTRTTLINLAGKEIFLHQKTGYLRKDDNKIDLGIIEKLASIFQKKE